VITMGWWGFSDDDRQVVARVGHRTITMDEYERAYRNYERAYRDALKEQFTPEFAKQLDLKHVVVNALVERQLWLDTAHSLGLTVTPGELAKSIAAISAFHNERTGQFDADAYRRVLAANRLSPEAFESAQREDLLITKVKALVSESTALSESEWDEARTRQAAQNPGPTSDTMLASPLPQKQERALRAYMTQVRRHADVEIHDNML
ncbi:MAG TPA: SurA N-terminal domain-containing protein, partial [Nitrospiria bacterium]|nr:SurA N-terminal domain-containing protein [Nitrospiria bacterium]